MPQDTTISNMTDTELCAALAQAQGYTHVGPFHGADLWHPPGSRTSVVPLPRYTDDWNLCMDLLFACQTNLTFHPPLLRVALEGTEVWHGIDQAACRRLISELALALMQEGAA